MCHTSTNPHNLQPPTNHPPHPHTMPNLPTLTARTLAAAGIATGCLWPSLLLLHPHKPQTAAAALAAWGALAILLQSRRTSARTAALWLSATWLGAATIWATGWSSWRFALWGAPAATTALAWLLWGPLPNTDGWASAIFRAAEGAARTARDTLLLTAGAAAILTAGGALLWPILHAGQSAGDMIAMGTLILGIALSVNWR